MNRASVNELALAANREVRAALPAQMALTATLPLKIGVIVPGTASMAMTAGARGNLHMRGQGSAQLQASADLTPMIRFRPGMAAQMTLSGSVTPFMRMRPIMGAEMALSSGLVSEIKKAPRLVGTARMHMQASGRGHVGKAHRPRLAITLSMRLQGRGSLHMVGSGTAAMEMQAEARRLVIVSSQYEPASEQWRFAVARDAWVFEVPQDRHTLEAQ